MIHTIDVWADTHGRGTCRGVHCKAAITWYETLAGRKMPFSGDPEPFAMRHDTDSGRLIKAIDLEATHWRTCPDWLAFKTRT